MVNNINSFMISKFWHRVKNIELQVNILIERTSSSDLFPHTHSLFLNWKLNTHRDTKKKERDRHRHIHLWIPVIWTKLKTLVHMNRSVRQIGRTVVECLLKNMYISLFWKEKFLGTGRYKLMERAKKQGRVWDGENRE